MWNELPKKNEQYYINELGLSELLASFFATKELSDEQVVNLINDKGSFSSPILLNDLTKAIERLNQAILNKEKVVIYGDYDCDGILGTSILLVTLRRLGLNAGYYIPNRFTDGYGLTVEKVNQFKEKGYELIITVDNGIAAIEAIKQARALEIDVIVTDHHNMADTLPEDSYLIHPKLSEQLQFKGFSGGMVAYKLAFALTKQHDPYLLSLAAITTVSDMMPIIDENHRIVKHGLKAINEHHFQELFMLKGNNEPIVYKDLSHKIAPMINSVGRFPEKINPNFLVQYFTKQMDEMKISAFIKKLNMINSERRNLVESEFKRLTFNQDEDVIVVYDDSIHEGITGLLANKFMRTYNKPTFVFTLDHEKKHYKGSARSLPGFELPDVFEALEDLLVAHGGHSFAGGMSIKVEDMEEFEEQLYIFGSDFTVQELAKEGISLDFPIAFDDVKQLENLEPFGFGFEKPSFILNNVMIVDKTLLKDGKHIKLVVDYQGAQLDAMLFNFKGDILDLEINRHLSLLGDLKTNEFMNKKIINIIVEDYELLSL